MQTEGGDSSAGESRPESPPYPSELIQELKSRLKKDDAPFLNHLERNLSMKWMDSSESRLGMTRFECNHNELFRRRRLRVSPGPITIGMNEILWGDSALYRHTLVHELLHAAGLLDHGTVHADLVAEIAPAPRLSDSPTLQRMRQSVLDKLPERQWICGDCGFTWERKRVTMPSRCPKCAKPFRAN